MEDLPEDIVDLTTYSGLEVGNQGDTVIDADLGRRPPGARFSTTVKAYVNNHRFLPNNPETQPVEKTKEEVYNYGRAVQDNMIEGDTAMQRTLTQLQKLPGKKRLQELSIMTHMLHHVASYLSDYGPAPERFNNFIAKRIMEGDPPDVQAQLHEVTEARRELGAQPARGDQNSRTNTPLGEEEFPRIIEETQEECDEEVQENTSTSTETDHQTAQISKRDQSHFLSSRSGDGGVPNAWETSKAWAQRSGKMHL
ncbi:hypothetical protein Bbelb_243000 [Branchiostoma belcheri]|nr:hypothetical protein Bbelb_243000 [Branchiostoma belcheri]